MSNNDAYNEIVDRLIEKAEETSIDHIASTLRSKYGGDLAELLIRDIKNKQQQQLGGGKRKRAEGLRDDDPQNWWSNCQDPVDPISQVEWDDPDENYVKIYDQGRNQPHCFERASLLRTLRDSTFANWIQNPITRPMDESGVGGIPGDERYHKTLIGDFITHDSYTLLFDPTIIEFDRVFVEGNKRIGNLRGTMGVGELHGQLPGYSVYRLTPKTRTNDPKPQVVLPPSDEEVRQAQTLEFVEGMEDTELNLAIIEAKNNAAIEIERMKQRILAGSNPERIINEYITSERNVFDNLLRQQNASNGRLLAIPTERGIIHVQHTILHIRPVNNNMFTTASRDSIYRILNDMASYAINKFFIRLVFHNIMNIFNASVQDPVQPNYDMPEIISSENHADDIRLNIYLRIFNSIRNELIDVISIHAKLTMDTEIERAQERIQHEEELQQIAEELINNKERVFYDIMMRLKMFSRSKKTILLKVLNMHGVIPDTVNLTYYLDGTYDENPKNVADFLGYVANVDIANILQRLTTIGEGDRDYKRYLDNLSRVEQYALKKELYSSADRSFDDISVIDELEDNEVYIIQERIAMAIDENISDYGANDGYEARITFFNVMKYLTQILELVPVDKREIIREVSSAISDINDALVDNMITAISGSQ